MDVKRGQVSIFILFGLIILIAFMFIFYLNNKIDAVEEEVKLQLVSSDLSTPIKNYVDLCLKRTGESALYFTGLKGGFYNEHTYNLESKGFFYDFSHAFYLYDNKNVMPKLSTIEKEISDYIEHNLNKCINDFKDFSNLGYEIKVNESSAKTSVNEDVIIFNLNFPLTIKKGQSLATLEEFSVEAPSRLNLIYNLAEVVTNEQLSHLGRICVSCLMELGEENDLYFELVPSTANTTIIAIEDSQTIFNNRPYILTFAFNHRINTA